jgi:hypothetical protein
MNCGLEPIEAAPMAYSVVSFLPTQTLSTRLVVLEKEMKKAPRISPGGFGGMMIQAVKFLLC